MKTGRGSVAAAALLSLQAGACSDFFGEPQPLDTGRGAIVSVLHATEGGGEASVGSVAVGASVIFAAVFVPRGASGQGSAWTLRAVPKDRKDAPSATEDEIFRQEAPESQGGRGYVAADGDDVFAAITDTGSGQTCVLFGRGVSGEFGAIASLVASDPSSGGSCWVSGLAATDGELFALVETAKQQGGGSEQNPFFPYSNGCCGAPTADGIVYAVAGNPPVPRAIATGRPFARLVESPILVDAGSVYWLEESAEAASGSITALLRGTGETRELFATAAGERPTALAQSDDALYVATTLSTGETEPLDPSRGCLLRRVDKRDGRATEIHRDPASTCLGLAVRAETTYAVTRGPVNDRGEQSAALLQIAGDGTVRSSSFERSDLYPREVLAVPGNGLLVVAARHVLAVDDLVIP